MKKLIVASITILLIAGCGVAVPITEDTKNFLNFYSDGKTVTWSEIYSYAPKDLELVREWYLRSFDMSDVQESRMIGKSRPGSLPIKEAGYDPMSVIMILQKPCVVYFVLEFKEDRCRVSVNDIIWDTETSVTARSGGIGITQGVGMMSLNDISLDEGYWKGPFYKNSGPQLNSMLEFMFMPKLQNIRNTEW